MSEENKATARRHVGQFWRNMASHPLNLAVRFLLEIAALLALGYWGFDQHSGIWRFVLGLGLPVLAAIAWGTFAVPDDRSRSGSAPVPVPGAVRLILELALFGLASWALYDAGRPVLALILAGVTVVHYVVSYDRIAWLLRHR
jgi:hypothetical protein